LPHFGWDLPHFGWDLPHFGWDLPHFGWDLPHFGWDLFGFFAPRPQQAGESNTLALRNPKEPPQLLEGYANLF